MYSTLMAGKKVDGLKLVEGRPGNRSWSSDKDVLETIAHFELGHEMMHKEVLMSPTEAEKQHKGSELWESLEKHVTRKPGQPSIATADDKRPEWKNWMSKNFGKDNHSDKCAVRDLAERDSELEVFPKGQGLQRLYRQCFGRILLAQNMENLCASALGIRFKDEGQAFGGSGESATDDDLDDDEDEAPRKSKRRPVEDEAPRRKRRNYEDDEE
ncbi:hypothetical protein GH714_044142 [Hevea brasiliensis]|uniref:Uncharacterized protein n=1 Tax=Hevea brasiliensis TaxID=3981 RepID=A0A6A6K2A7_HEVBR|nr:hypothetical protein GH714_044142 [Hevea brasiliensis]